MHCSFVDGSKTMVEMAAVANATGLVPDVRGMHGPVTEVKNLPKVFSLVSQGGVLQQKGVVDYARGEIAPGVFVIITTDNPLIREDLWFERMGDGPNYLLFRPYHLCDMETPLSAVLAQVYGEPTLIPLGQPVAEVFTVAKRDLKAGEVLDGFGGYTMYGEIDRASVVREQRLLPAGWPRAASFWSTCRRDARSPTTWCLYPETALWSTCVPCRTSWWPNHSLSRTAKRRLQ